MLREVGSETWCGGGTGSAFWAVKVHAEFRESRVPRDFALNKFGQWIFFHPLSFWFLNLKIDTLIFYLVWILFSKYDSFKKNTKDIFKKHGKNNTPPSLGRMAEGPPLTSLTGCLCFPLPSSHAVQRLLQAMYLQVLKVLLHWNVIVPSTPSAWNATPPPSLSTWIFPIYLPCHSFQEDFNCLTRSHAPSPHSENTVCFCSHTSWTLYIKPCLICSRTIFPCSGHQCESSAFITGPKQHKPSVITCESVSSFPSSILHDLGLRTAVSEFTRVTASAQGHSVNVFTFRSKYSKQGSR